MRVICKRSKWGKYGSVSLKLYGFENGLETWNAASNAVNVMELREELDAMQSRRNAKRHNGGNGRIECDKCHLKR